MKFTRLNDYLINSLKTRGYDLKLIFKKSFQSVNAKKTVAHFDLATKVATVPAKGGGVAFNYLKRELLLGC